MPIAITSYDPRRPVTVEFPTVAEFIEFLSFLPQDAAVGFTGHFGDMHPLDLRSVYVRSADRVAHMWTGTETDPFSIVSIDVPDIGPEPN